MSKKTFIHAENNHNILSSNEVRLYNPPKPEEMKIIIWDKELCNGTEWNDFLKCVEDKTKEIDQLKQQLDEKEKRIETFKKQLKNAIVMPFILPTYYLCGEWHTKILLGFDNYSSPKMEYFHNKEKDKVIKQAEQKLKELLKGEKDVKE